MPAAVSVSTTATISEARSPNLARSPDVLPQCLQINCGLVGVLQILLRD
jgi:hypothetical protein